MRKLKKLGLIFLATLLVILPVVSGLTMLAEPMLAAETETVDSSESLGDMSSLPTEQSAELTNGSIEQPIIEEVEESSQTPETVESTEPEVNESEAETAVTQPQEDSSDTSPILEQPEQASSGSLRNADEAFQSSIQTDVAGQLEAAYLRDENASDSATVNWKVLKNDGYHFTIQLNNYQPTGSVSNRKIEVEIPRGLLVSKAQIDDIVRNNSNVTSRSIVDEDTSTVYGINQRFRRYELGTLPNTTPSDYYNGVTIIFDVSPSTTTLGFTLDILPNYEDGTISSPNFWTGITGDSLTRKQPLKVRLVEDALPVKTLVMDDFIIPSTAEISMLTRGADASSTTPSSQTLDEDLQMVIQTRSRNTTESSTNAYYMGNMSFQAYLPYKKLSNGNYLSATLVTEKMDAWIASTSASNNGTPTLKYSVDPQADGRMIITYSFVDTEQEYLLRMLDLELHYRFPSQGFSVEDRINYTRDNLGWTLKNYSYDESGNRSMTESKKKILTDSTSSIPITSGEKFNFNYLSRPASYTHSTISTNGTQAAALLGFALLRNESPTEGKAEVSYQFDKTTKWEYGVTTVQFWTIDPASVGGLANARNYTYNFDFALQRKGAGPGDGIVRGTYALKPSEAYAGVKISKTDTKKENLLGYANERYYYYVNRDMLASGTFSSELPTDFDIDDYYIKDLSYELDIKANYVSGSGGRAKESGGQFYGHTFVNEGTAGRAQLEIKPAGGYSGNTLSNEFKTTIIDKTQNGDDTGLFLAKSMTIKDEVGKTLQTSSDRVDVGKKVTVSATALQCFYPYGAGSYAPDPVFLIRTPIDLTLDVPSIQMNQVGNPNSIQFTIDAPITLDDGSKLYYVKPTNSNGLGYFDENRELIGDMINITYKMEVNISARSEAIAYRELLFVADQNYGTHYLPSASYFPFLANDVWGIASKLDPSKARFYFTNGVAEMATTSSGNVFNTNPPELDFGYYSEIESGLSADVKDPVNQEYGGVLDKEPTTFTADLFYTNTKQYGYVENSGRLIFYLPIAKKGVKLPEWADTDQVNEFSLSLKGPLNITSSNPDVTYKVGYSVDTTKPFNNNQSNFADDGTSAVYLPYDQVATRLDSVTMIKVYAESNETTGQRVPFGEELTARMTLGFSSESDKAFYDLTGEKTEWKAYVSQVYTMGGARNELPGTTTEKVMRIRYRPEQEVIELWAYDDEDYPGGSGGNKTATHPLPDFVNQFNLQLKSFTNASFTNMTLASIPNIKSNAESSTSYANTTFGFSNGLNVPDINDENDDNVHDLIEAASEDLAFGSLKVAGVPEEQKPINNLSYRIYNANNINENLSDREIKLVYTSPDGSDDIYFEVVIKIRRRMSLINAETALMAGKVYREFTNAENNPDTTLEDGAFTFQYVFDENASKLWPLEVNAKDLYLKFAPKVGSDQLKSSLPAGDTILMKIQSTDASTPPEYYYYRNNAENKSEILLTEFKKMGTTVGNDEFLTLEEIKEHTKQAENLSYLFIFDFANEDATVSSTDSIGLVFDFGPSWQPSYRPFEIKSKRTIENQAPALNSTTYEEHEPIQLSGALELNDVVPAVDSYNLNKSLALGLELYEVNGSNKTQISWPQGVLLQDTRDPNNPGSLIRPKKVDDKLEFIYEAGAISTATEIRIPYQLKIYTAAQALAANTDNKKYEVRVTVLRDYSGTHPMNVDSSTTDELEFNVILAEKKGLRVQSSTNGNNNSANGLVYNRTDGQQVTFDFNADNIRKIVPELQVKASGTYIPMTTTWSSVIATPQPASIIPANPFTIQFESEMSSAQNAEYRIVFKAYENDGDTEPLYEVPWTFLIWDPPS